MSILVHAPRPRRGIHSGSVLDWDESNANEFSTVAAQLSSIDIIIKPRELHLAFDWGSLRSTKFSRFKPLQLDKGKGKASAAASRSNTTSSIRSLAATVHADVAILITRPVRRESTYIVWGALMSLDTPAAPSLPPRNVFVKIAVDEEGADDLREDARLHKQLADRGLRLGYYGIFVDSIGSTAVVTEDYEGELDVVSPAPSP